MKAKFQHIPPHLSSCLLTLIVAIGTSGCSGGTHSNPSNPQSKQLTLQQYITQLDYHPLASQDKAQSQTKQAISLKIPSPTKLGNQQIFTAIAPVTLGTIQMNYYSDASCNSLVYTTTIGQQEQPVTIPAGSYSTTDQSNYSLCSVYKDNEGCESELSDAENHVFTSIRYAYNLSNGTTVTSACMHNNTYTFDALADYSQEPPTACTDGNACGYSQTYGAQLLTIPTVTGIGIIPSGANFFIGSNCLLDGSLANNLHCWGNNSYGNLGNNVTLPQVPAPVVMPSGVTTFKNLVINSITSRDNDKTTCAIAAGGEQIGKVYCWGNGNYGEIGNSQQLNVSQPTPITMPTGVTSFTQLAAGTRYFCGLGNDQNAYCWGNSTSGNLGNGQNLITSSVPIPVTMPTDVKFTTISSNTSFSCALSTTGHAYCWGANNFGQIGNDSMTSVLAVPTAVHMPDGVTFTSISTNQSYSCALASNNKAYCWGYNANGQIGNNSTINALKPVAVEMPEGITFTALTTSSSFSCAIANNQHIYCWGSNTNGQIGNGTLELAKTPSQVQMPSGVTGFTQVALANTTACAIAIVTAGDTQTHPIYCWGHNINGALGINSSNFGYNSTTPVQVNMPTGVTNFTSLTSSNFNFCAVGDDNKTYCWGAGDSGQIGNGTLTNALVPTAVIMPQGTSYYTHLTLGRFYNCAIANNQQTYCWGFRSLQPDSDNLGRNNQNLNTATAVSQPSGTSVFNAISISTTNACVIAGAGANLGHIYCWGEGTLGQIGNNTTLSTSEPTAVNMPQGVTSFSQVATTDKFSCAIANTGTIYCWGDNTYGTIGNNSTTTALVPTAIDMPNGVSSFSTLSSNNDYSCALANTGNIYCWGNGALGQMGTGQTQNINSVPKAVVMPSGVTRFLTLSAKTNSICALANNGKIYCWGNGTQGQMGNGQTIPVNATPVEVNLPEEINSFTQLSTSSYFSCAIANTGKAYCWGSGSNGQIGNGQTIAINNTPQAVSMPDGVTSFTMLSTASVNQSYGVACALANNGKAYCWGGGNFGQIGNGKNDSITNVPSEVTMPPGVNSFGYIYTNGMTSCAIAASGSNAGKTYCWGGGSSGQIGNGANLDVNIPTQVISGI